MIARYSPLPIVRDTSSSAFTWLAPISSVLARFSSWMIVAAMVPVSARRGASIDRVLGRLSARGLVHLALVLLHDAVADLESPQDAIGALHHGLTFLRALFDLDVRLVACACLD